MFSNQNQFQTGIQNNSFNTGGVKPSHTHSSQAVSVSMELQELEKSLTEAQTLKVQAETNLNHYRQQFQETNMELQQLGIDPNNAKAELEQLSKEVLRQVNELKALMPHTLVDELKAELNKPLEIEIDLPNEDIIF